MKVKLKVALSRAMWVCPPSSPQDSEADHTPSIAVFIGDASPEFNPTNVSLCLSLKTLLSSSSSG